MQHQIDFEEGDIVYFHFAWGKTDVRIDQICDHKHVYFTVMSGMYKGTSHYRPMEDFIQDVGA